MFEINAKKVCLRSATFGRYIIDKYIQVKRRYTKMLTNVGPHPVTQDVWLCKHFFQQNNKSTMSFRKK